MVLEMSRFFVFQGGGHQPYWFFEISNFQQPVALGAMYITMRNFIKIGQTVMGIQCLTIFKMAAICLLDFQKFEFLNCHSGLEGLGTTVQNLIKIGQTVLEISQFSMWHLSTILDFNKNFYIFSSLSDVVVQYASPYQISSKCAKRLLIYSHLSFLKMAAIRHFGFVWHILGPPMKII